MTTNVLKNSWNTYLCKTNVGWRFKILCPHIFQLHKLSVWRDMSISTIRWDIPYKYPLVSQIYFLPDLESHNKNDTFIKDMMNERLRRSVKNWKPWTWNEKRSAVRQKEERRNLTQRKKMGRRRKKVARKVVVKRMIRRWRRPYRMASNQRVSAASLFIINDQ